MFFCQLNTWGERKAGEWERWQALALGCCSHHMCFERTALHFQVKHQHLNTMWVNNSYPLLQGMVTEEEKLRRSPRALLTLQIWGLLHSQVFLYILSVYIYNNICCISRLPFRCCKAPEVLLAATQRHTALQAALSWPKHSPSSGQVSHLALPPDSVSSTGCCAQQSGTTRAAQQLPTSWLASCQRWGHFL